jgi:hypothetical protein
VFIFFAVGVYDSTVTRKVSVSGVFCCYATVF